METIWLLVILACPIVMGGLMVWMIVSMRHGRRGSGERSKQGET